jgi:basic membrane protein A
MRRFTTASLALTIAATSLLAGSVAVMAQNEDVKIGMVTDVGKLEDKSFNEYTWIGAKDAAEALGAPEVAVVITEEFADYQNNVQQLIDEDFDVIITAGSLLGTDTYNAAVANPDIKFIGIDQNTATDETPNFHGVTFAEAEPAYLVGMVAATISESGVIGAIGGANVPAVVRLRDGYYNGALAANPDIQVLYQEANPDPAIGFNDPERGSEIASQMIDLGADVIFQIAANTGVGALEAACEAGIYGMGVDVDQSKSLPPQAAECVVTSAEKKLRGYTNAIAQSAVNGTFEGGTHLYNFASDPVGVGLSPFQEKYADLLTPELQAALDEAVAGFIDGSIDPAVPMPQ